MSARSIAEDADRQERYFRRMEAWHEKRVRVCIRHLEKAAQALNEIGERRALVHTLGAIRELRRKNAVLIDKENKPE